MKFKTKKKSWGEGTYVYEPKNRKVAEQIMQLHRDMGDEILILEDDDEETEVSEDS